MADIKSKTNKPSLSKAMEQAILVLSHKKPGNADVVYRNLYTALAASKRLGTMVSDNNLTQKELMDISRRLLNAGLCWEKHIFMPVQIFCRMKPLRYVLENKEILLGMHGQEVFFNAYNHLKMFFINFLG